MDRRCALVGIWCPTHRLFNSDIPVKEARSGDHLLLGAIRPFIGGPVGRGDFDVHAPNLAMLARQFDRKGQASDAEVGVRRQGRTT